MIDIILIKGKSNPKKAEDPIYYIRGDNYSFKITDAINQEFSKIENPLDSLTFPELETLTWEEAISSFQNESPESWVRGPVIGTNGEVISFAEFASEMELFY